MMTDTTRARLIELSKVNPDLPIPSLVLFGDHWGRNHDWPAWSLQVLCETEDTFGPRRIVPTSQTKVLSFEEAWGRKPRKRGLLARLFGKGGGLQVGEGSR